MHCNGKCQMIKKLKQEENTDSQNSERKNEIKTDILFFAQIKLHLYNQLFNKNRIFPILQYKITKDISAEFFHPPSAI